MRYARILLSAFAVLLLLAACTVDQGELFQQALEESVIDFEGLPEGYVVDSVSAGMGISGYDAGGFVGVNGLNPVFGAGTNAAIIFDATCSGAPATCSGGLYAPGEIGTGPGAYLPGNGNNDDDLYNVDLGNVLIIAENLVDVDADGNIDDPDDADTFNEAFAFDFSTWGDGSVVVEQVVLTVQDVEQSEDEGGFLRLFGEGGLEIATIELPTTEDGGTATVTVDVDYAPVLGMTVDLDGSGAIDNIRVSTDVPDLAPGRFTGGINFVDERGADLRTQAPRGDDGLVITGGLTLHCDNELSNNLEINWATADGQNRWHIRKESLTDVICLDDPNIEQRPPRAPLDTLIAQADGRLTYGDHRNAPGSLIRFTIVDAGEPGRDDTMKIMIWEPGADPDSDAPILDVYGHLRRGANLQAHYDQPHGNNWNR